MPVDPAPWISLAVLFALATLIGMGTVRKLIQVYEAKHELKQGSAGFIRSISGWSLIAFWLMATWFFATIVGDWATSGSLEGALDRAWLRLRILLEIAAAIADSLMDQVNAHQTELLCANCGGQCAFEPAQQGLVCGSCGSVHAIDGGNDAEAQAEFPYDPEVPCDEPPETEGETVHHCETCGGHVVFTGPALSDRCPYCDGPVVLGKEGTAFETMALIPFRVPEEDAVGYIAKWVGNRIAAPNDLEAVAETGRVAGLYAPFWTFDSNEAIEYWATYVTGSGDNRRRHRVRGKMKVQFDDLLVPASPHVTPLIRDGILHDFYPPRLREYRAAYLAGFAAERHHQKVGDGLKSNARDKDLLIRNRIKRKVNKRGVDVTKYRTDTSGIHYRRILLPVWILHYSYGGTAKKIVVSGIDGRTFGERPFSRAKLAAYSAAISLGTIAFGWLWGAAGFL
ncbi:MAG: hypothetical protein AAGP08_01035 [Pseudomonadota bacterium]